MRLRPQPSLVLLALAASLSAFAAPKPCVPADKASKLLKKDVCISAHVYDVVQLPDGTRYLDVCTPQTQTTPVVSPLSACGKTITKWASSANTAIWM